MKQSVPTETLSHIFTFTLPPHLSNEEPAPWTISAVCSHWRQTVISQPRFWAFIDLNYYNRKKFTNRFRLETQLSRSAGLPLNVVFTTDQTLTSEDSSFLRLITMHAGRWATLSMMGATALYTHLHGCLHDQFTLLRVLTVEMQYGHADGQDDGVEVDENAAVPLLVTFKDAPRLQQVSVNKIYYPFPLSLALPWSQVLRFSGSNKWDGHLHVLRRTTNLVSCSLQIPYGSETLTVPKTPILLPHLLRLCLPEAAFLECLETPALQELYCPYAPPLLPFLSRQRQLQKLYISRAPPVYQNGVGFVPGNTPDLSRIVEAAATITTLALMFPLPAAFMRDFSSLDMVPALERLAIVRTGEENSEFQNDFMHAVESRRQRGRLRSVKLSITPGSWAPGILDRIELLQSQGMDFVVESFLKIRDEMAPDF
ncbi:hypothetical protein B0H12DRAFT_1329644 [Mycena haematopus]|nr:hypothetical protein B0H12DRAFT_1329644 [Mycena haematopus]